MTRMGRGVRVLDSPGVVTAPPISFILFILFKPATLLPTAFWILMLNFGAQTGNPVSASLFLELKR